MAYVYRRQMSRIDRIRATVEEARIEHEAWKASRPAPAKRTEQWPTQSQWEQEFYRAKIWAEKHYPVSHAEAKLRQDVLKEASLYLMRKRGTSHGKKKVADTDRRIIRARREAGESPDAIAAEYGIKRRTVWKITTEDMTGMAA